MDNQPIYDLTLVEYDENDQPDHTTLATYRTKAQMIKILNIRQKKFDDLYKCFVTEWDIEEDEILNQENAQEWI